MVLMKFYRLFSVACLIFALSSCSNSPKEKQKESLKEMGKKECPYGKWESAITPELIAEGRKFFQSIAIVDDDIYWTEMRPSEKGRYVLVRYTKEGKSEDVIPEGFNVRTRVYEYGGKAFAIAKEVVYFVNFADQRIYEVKKGQDPKPLTAEGTRFADLSLTKDGLIGVAEKHRKENSTENYLDVDNYLVWIDVNTGEESTIASGYDFYSFPTVNATGDKIAWLCWNHPDMSWDSTELWAGDLRNGKIENAKKVLGGNKEALFQPRWSKDNTLYYVSDKTGWWNLYRFKDGQEENLYPTEAEFGMPQWIFGLSTWDFTADGNILCTFNQEGFWRLGMLNPDTKEMHRIDLGGTDYSQIHVGKNFAAFIQGSPTKAKHVVRMDLSNNQATTIAANAPVDIDVEDLSVAQAIKFPSVNNRMIYGYYYPPRNKTCRGPSNEQPPLIVIAHGGPIAATTTVLSLANQFWTNRGFAVLDVDYGGSTGYGRQYRELLTENWGIVDVEDCQSGAEFLVKQGLVNPKHLAIRGGSAGGYTTLCALTFGKTFTVGASYFGISDLIALAKETHKMEAHLTDKLIALYPEQEQILRERSPLFYADQICCPVIFFQGAEDKIVPIDQAEVMYDALKKRGIMTELVVYPEEQHGFRQANNIADSHRKELEFYLKVFYK